MILLLAAWFLNLLKKQEIEISDVVLGTTTQIEYLIFQDGLMLPVYPIGIELDYGSIKLLEEVKLSTLDSYLGFGKLSSLKEHDVDDSSKKIDSILQEYGYIIKNILIQYWLFQNLLLLYLTLLI